MSGAIFETFVLCELLKSWWHRMQTPELYYYRDKDGREIDFLLLNDGNFYPIEAKRSATPQRDWVRSFSSLERFSPKVGEGGVVCLCSQIVPLAENASAIPAGIL